MNVRTYRPPTVTNEERQKLYGSVAEVVLVNEFGWSTNNKYIGDREMCIERFNRLCNDRFKKYKDFDPYDKGGYDAMCMHIDEIGYHMPRRTEMPYIKGVYNANYGLAVCIETLIQDFGFKLDDVYKFVYFVNEYVQKKNDIGHLPFHDERNTMKSFLDDVENAGIEKLRLKYNTGAAFKIRNGVM